MSYYEEGNYVVIHGGRNDLSSDSFALNDTYLLELSKLSWIQVTLYFDNLKNQVYNRCGHSSIIYSKNIILKFSQQTYSYRWNE
jgi:hypothetical protein